MSSYLPEVSVPAIQIGLFVIAVITLALCVEAAIAKKYELKDDEVKE